MLIKGFFMKPVYRNLLITTVISLAIGILGMVPVVRSDNGYVAGYVFFPLLLLLAGACIVLFIIGIILLAGEKKGGLYFLLAMLLLPVGFFGSAFIAKHFEMGAYREDPMVPLTPEVSNIVIFVDNLTNDQMNSFWDETLATEREDKRGHTSLPGISGVTRLPAKDGREVVEFSFFANATQEQKDFVYSKVKESPLVFKLLENISTKDYMILENTPSNNNLPKKEFKVTRTVNSNP